MEAGGRWLPASSPRGRILTRGRRGRAQQHRTEQQCQPHPDPHPALGAAATPWCCRFRLCHHRLSRRRLAAALPALVSFLRPFPGLSALARSQSPPAAAGSSPNRRGLPAHPTAPPPGCHALANHYARLSHRLSRLDHGVTDMAPVNWQLRGSTIPELGRESRAKRT